ncbi:MAG TPA: TIGR03435 family protein [Bryobacteraceae bacterium]|nr:TIGR03435 family protein [Bryobacteraceae bacterium]
MLNQLLSEPEKLTSTTNSFLILLGLVASIRPSRPGRQGMIQKLLGRFVATGLTLENLITTAFQIPALQITGGPDWWNADRFDVNAIASSDPAQTPPTAGQLQQMLQALLAERFHLRSHRETKELGVLQLVVKKPNSGLTKNAGQPYEVRRRGRRISFQKVTMAQLTGDLSGMFVSDELDGRVIVDRTNLSGDFDFTLDWAPNARPLAALGDLNRPSLISALKELGLGLEPGKAPMDILVIDNVQRPSPN